VRDEAGTGGQDRAERRESDSLDAVMKKTPESSPTLDRREVLKSGAVVSTLAVFSQLRLGKAESHVEAATAGGTSYLRPPGAIDEEEFLRRCIRCHKCGENCTNSCIRFVGPEGPPEARGNNGCPSGALQAIDPEHPKLWEVVEMGEASLDTNICHSHQGCWRSRWRCAPACDARVGR
jgi:ferredoxin-type protein NapG